MTLPTVPAVPIVFFGNDWSAENRTSSHHIARWLSKRHEVLYVECPGLRPPKHSGRDIRKLTRKVGSSLRGARRVEDGLRVATLLQAPFHRFAAARRLNRLFTRLSVRLLMRQTRLSRPISWFMVPHVGSLAGNLGEQLSVYYCIDDYAALPDVDAEAVRSMDDDLSLRADLVFVASETLLPRKRALNAHSYLSPHGVDRQHFSRALHAELPLPPELASLRRPVVGFIGLVERWIDLDLVAYLASQRPSWQFVMIGRLAVPRSDIPHLTNLHFLGWRSYDDLPRYGAGLDAAIIPYRSTQQVFHANPMKLREYLAMGLPTVAVSTPEIDKYRDVIRVATSREEFLSQLDLAVSERQDEALQKRRAERVSVESWDNRLEAVMAVVMDRLRARAAQRAQGV